MSRENNVAALRRELAALTKKYEVRSREFYDISARHERLLRYAEVRGTVGFNPLYTEARGHGMDDKCCCRYCSPAPREARDNPDGVWDTLATDLITGKTWKVHHPALHGRAPKRPRD